ncbi:MAG: cobalt transporter CbiM [Methanomicrobiaceae archaeon]|uniref:Substrate-specific component nikm of nickel ecf transporter n=1 Tax=hydrocarbon metagenome TaxID=938273 RepID=A0A0W8FJH4_9ZZZZ|nr:cobalt transporter CbiM [Methanomicrobiaceae archaeon]MDD5418502.1 cobalt transporter CbiM [Methanomicrobiaceae archaeon]
MHIPDAFIPIAQAIVYWIIALIFIFLALRWARQSMGEEKVPLVAVLAAGIFAVQALNIPIPWGTSGHMVGAALAAVVLGSPYAGIFVLTLVLLVQGIVFADGGITTMGANIVNMVVVGSFFGFYAYTAIQRIIAHTFAATFVAGWLSLFVSALIAAVQLGLAGTFPLEFGLLSMGLYHSVIGLIEGGITAAALYLIATARPEIVERAEAVSG